MRSYGKFQSLNLSCAVFAFALLAIAANAVPAETEKITQDGLVRRTQELVDSIAVGNQTPWKTYFAKDAVYTDETGKTMDKPALIANVSPLPKGYSGTIKVVKPQSRILGQTAVLSYDLDETETVFGQVLHARYHGTNTWLWRNGRWQIVAGQLLRFYEDPAVGTIDTAHLDDFVGTYELAPGVTLTVSREGAQLYPPNEAMLPKLSSSPNQQTSSSAPASRVAASFAETTAAKSTR